jgi:hypothetical protein
LTSEQFREMGRYYLKRLIDEFPDGSLARQAEEELRGLEAPRQP